MRIADDRATRYHRWQFSLGIANLLITVACLAAIIKGQLVQQLTPGAPPPWWLLVAGLTVAIGLALKLVTLPVDWVRAYWLPRRFGLLHQSLGRWCWDRLKASALGGVLALVAFEMIYALLRLSEWWWLWAALGLLAGSVLLAVVAPVWIIPLFYRVVPLEDASLKARLLELARRVGVAVIGVWVVDQSHKSRTANAALTGLGKTRRIVLFDTLVAQFTAEEIESVLAHELGHHVHGHVRHGLLMQGAVLLATLWVADHLLRAGSPGVGYESLTDPAGLPLLALTLLVLGLVAAPIANAFSRRLERQADDFALTTTKNPRAFISAMERLARLNLAERRPNRLKEFLLHSHPSIDRRIERAERALVPPADPSPLPLSTEKR